MEMDEDASNANLNVGALDDVGYDGDVSSSLSRHDGEVEHSASTLEEDIISDFEDSKSSVDW